MNTNRTERASERASEWAGGVVVNGLNDHRGMGSFVESDKALLLCNDRGGDSITERGSPVKKCDAGGRRTATCPACEEHEQLRVTAIISPSGPTEWPRGTTRADEGRGGEQEQKREDEKETFCTQDEAEERASERAQQHWPLKIIEFPSLALKHHAKARDGGGGGKCLQHCAVTLSLVGDRYWFRQVSAYTYTW